MSKAFQCTIVWITPEAWRDVRGVTDSIQPAQGPDPVLLWVGFESPQSVPIKPNDTSFRAEWTALESFGD